MTRFRFGLDRLLRLRTGEELGLARVLALAATEAEARNLLARVEEQCHLAALDQASRVREAGATAGTFVVLHLAVQHADTEARNAAEAAATAARRRLEAEAAYLLARGKRQSLEKLRDRRRDEWQGEDRRADQRLTDEVASRRHQPESDCQP
jgi:flagellar export protein FliJ